MLHALESARRAVAGNTARGPKRTTNLRAVAGESMLRALEPAHRAAAGNNAS